MSKPDMNALMQQFLNAQANGTTVNLATAAPAPAAVAVAEPAPAPTPELAAANAEFTLPTDPAALAEFIKAAMAARAVAPAPAAPAKAKAKGEWASADVELANGEKLHLRVAPKGYGCVGFESRSDYSCIFGYKERHEAVATLFGQGYRDVVLAKLIEMGMKARTEG
jgi:hypothetical protein